VNANPGAPALDHLLSRYLEAQLAGDRRTAARVVIDEGLGAGHSVHALHTGVLQAAQREIGRLWQQNRISIAEEHMATAISHVVASRLFQEAKASSRVERRVVVACVEGEYHEFPSRLVADFLDLGGFDVSYLGANVPTDHLLDMLEGKPDMLALSVTMSFNVPALREALVRIRERFPDLPILVGGHALAWEPALVIECGVDTCRPDAESLVATARRLTGVDPA